MCQNPCEDGFDCDCQGVAAVTLAEHCTLTTAHCTVHTHTHTHTRTHMALYAQPRTFTLPFIYLVFVFLILFCSFGIATSETTQTIAATETSATNTATVTTESTTIDPTTLLPYVAESVQAVRPRLLFFNETVTIDFTLASSIDGRLVQRIEFVELLDNSSDDNDSNGDRNNSSNGYVANCTNKNITNRTLSCQLLTGKLGIFRAKFFGENANETGYEAANSTIEVFDIKEILKNARVSPLHIAVARPETIAISASSQADGARLSLLLSARLTGLTGLTGDSTDYPCRLTSTSQVQVLGQVQFTCNVSAHGQLGLRLSRNVESKYSYEVPDVVIVAVSVAEIAKTVNVVTPRSLFVNKLTGVVLTAQPAPSSAAESQFVTKIAINENNNWNFGRNFQIRGSGSEFSCQLNATRAGDFPVFLVDEHGRRYATGGAVTVVPFPTGLPTARYGLRQSRIIVQVDLPMSVQDNSSDAGNSILKNVKYASDSVNAETRECEIVNRKISCKIMHNFTNFVKSFTVKSIELESPRYTSNIRKTVSANCPTFVTNNVDLSKIVNDNYEYQLRTEPVRALENFTKDHFRILIGKRPCKNILLENSKTQHSIRCKLYENSQHSSQEKENVTVQCWGSPAVLVGTVHYSAIITHPLIIASTVIACLLVIAIILCIAKFLLRPRKSIVPIMDTANVQNPVGRANNMIGNNQLFNSRLFDRNRYTPRKSFYELEEESIDPEMFRDTIKNKVTSNGSTRWRRGSAFLSDSIQYDQNQNECRPSSQFRDSKNWRESTRNSGKYLKSNLRRSSSQHSKKSIEFHTPASTIRRVKSMERDNYPNKLKGQAGKEFQRDYDFNRRMSAPFSIGTAFSSQSDLSNIAKWNEPLDPKPLQNQVQSSVAP